jgi:putative NIF3 family GTP cyclohydrolase 1 type 2
MPCGESALAAAVAAIRHAHPYEEPPIEIHPLRPLPHPIAGGGRVLTLRKAVPLRTLARRLEARLGVPIAAASAAGRTVSRVAVVAGSGGSLLPEILSASCDAFITGELSHHRVLEATSRGCAVLLAGHTNTERPYLPTLAARLRRMLPGLEVRPSRADRDPFASR